MGTCVHFSRSLPSNSWWQTMVGGKSCQGRQPPKAGAAGPPLQGLPPSHTRPPRSTAGNIRLSRVSQNRAAVQTMRFGAGSSRRQDSRSRTTFTQATSARTTATPYRLRSRISSPANSRSKASTGTNGNAPISRAPTTWPASGSWACDCSAENSAGARIFCSLGRRMVEIVLGVVSGYIAVLLRR